MRPGNVRANHVLDEPTDSAPSHNVMEASVDVLVDRDGQFLLHVAFTIYGYYTYAFGTELYKYFVFGDSNWNYATYDFSSWPEDTARTAAILNATSTDLDAFKKAGGRLILWQGWSVRCRQGGGAVSTPDGRLRHTAWWKILGFW